MLADISGIVVACYLYRKLIAVITEEASKKAEHVVDFGRMAHVLEETFSLSHNEVVFVTGELRRVGVLEYIRTPECEGWRLLPLPTHEETDPLLTEFGHACHGCAHYPCEKSKVGELLGDCWEYEKMEG